MKFPSLLVSLIRLGFLLLVVELVHVSFMFWKFEARSGVGNGNDIVSLEISDVGVADVTEGVVAVSDAVSDAFEQPQDAEIAVPVSEQPQDAEIAVPVSEQPQDAEITTPVSEQPQDAEITTPVSEQPQDAEITTPVSEQPQDAEITAPVSVSDEVTTTRNGDMVIDIEQLPANLGEFSFYLYDAAVRLNFQDLKLSFLQQKAFEEKTLGDFAIRNKEKKLPPRVFKRLIPVEQLTLVLVDSVTGAETEVACRTRLNTSRPQHKYVQKRFGASVCPFTPEQAERARDADGDFRVKLIVSGNMIKSRFQGAKRLVLNIVIPGQSRSAGLGRSVARAIPPQVDRTKPSREGGRRVSACVSLSNYSEYLHEIIAYYQLIGMTHVYFGLNRRVVLPQTTLAGPQFEPETGSLMDAFKPYIDTGFVSVFNHRVTDGHDFAMSSAMEKLVFWNSCVYHASGAGDDWAFISDVDELLVVNSAYKSIGDWVSDMAKISPQHNHPICSLTMKRWNVVKGKMSIAASPLTSEVNNKYLGVEFMDLVPLPYQTYGHKQSIVEKCIVSKFGTDIGFHSHQCETSNVDYYIHSGDAMINHFPNMYVSRNSANITSTVLSNYTQSWFPRVREYMSAGKLLDWSPPAFQEQPGSPDGELYVANPHGIQLMKDQLPGKQFKLARLPGSVDNNAFYIFDAVPRIGHGDLRIFFLQQNAFRARENGSGKGSSGASLIDLDQVTVKIKSLNSGELEVTECTTRKNAVASRKSHVGGVIGLVTCPYHRWEGRVRPTDVVLRFSGKPIQDHFGTPVVTIVAPVGKQALSGIGSNITKKFPSKSALQRKRTLDMAVCLSIPDWTPYLEELLFYYKSIGVQHIYLGPYSLSNQSRGKRSGLKNKLMKYLKVEGLSQILSVYSIDLHADKSVTFSPAVQKVAFWNSCYYQATARGADWVYVGEVDDVLVPSAKLKKVPTMLRFLEKHQTATMSTCYFTMDRWGVVPREASDAGARSTLGQDYDSMTFLGDKSAILVGQHDVDLADGSSVCRDAEAVVSTPSRHVAVNHFQDIFSSELPSIEQQPANGVPNNYTANALSPSL